ncbi:unnamed protein product [Lampetra planeri]
METSSLLCCSRLPPYVADALGHAACPRTACRSLSADLLREATPLGKGPGGVDRSTAPRGSVRSRRAQSWLGARAVPSTDGTASDLSGGEASVTARSIRIGRLRSDIECCNIVMEWPLRWSERASEEDITEAASAWIKGHGANKWLSAAAGQWRVARQSHFCREALHEARPSRLPQVAARRQHSRAAATGEAARRVRRAP